MMTVGAWRQIKYLSRYRQVGNVLIKNGFGFMVQSVRTHRFWGGETQDSIPKRIRSVCEELGPTFVKMGQLLSTRADLLGPSYIRELEKLQDQVLPLPLEAIRTTLNRSGLDMNATFAWFKEEPLAAGSIGQVHEAHLITGQHVVVKVKRPGIDQQVRTDLAIIAEMASYAEKHNQWARFYHLSGIVQELAYAVQNELDFRKEARNAQRFRDNYRGHAKVWIPAVYWAYCSQDVMVMEYAGGIKISDQSALIKAGHCPKTIVENLVDALFQQIYMDGLFHADPHPGNIAVAEGERIIFYDFGQVGFVDEETRDKYIDLVIAMMRYDVPGVTRGILHLSSDYRQVQVAALRRDVAQLGKKYYGVPMSQIQLGEAMREILDLSVKHGLRMPPDLSLMAKMLLTLENLISHLDPNIRLIDIAEPYGKKAVLRRYTLKRLRTGMVDNAAEILDLAATLPRSIMNLVRKMEDGDFQLKMEYTNIKDIIIRFDVISNRFSLAIILAGVIIGCSLLVDRSCSGFLGSTFLFETGLILALVIGLYLAYSILRSGRY